jgi:hypothetical protein
VKLEHQTAVEIEPENRVVHFTRRVCHARRNLFASLGPKVAPTGDAKLAE